MGLIREPLDVDFVVDPRPLTEGEKETINKYIRDYKTKHSDKKKIVRTSGTREKITA